MTATLGCIADDLTGATDLASILVQSGMRVVLLIGVPARDVVLPPVDAVVVALKSRTNPAAEAVSESLAAWSWLRDQGLTRWYFKYCSTFDSTNQGNIGPVLHALQKAAQSPFTIACPAFPANRRTVYQGHLFVGTQLLSDSSMRTHPLTPMTDANLVNVLSRQYPRPVHLIEHHIVNAGASALTAKLIEAQAQGMGAAIVDATSDHDLMMIGTAAEAATLPLISGGSALAGAWASAILTKVANASRPATLAWPPFGGGAVVIAGSCSTATRAQIAAWPHEQVEIDPFLDDSAAHLAELASSRAKAGLLAGRPVLFHAGADPDRVRRLQERHGVEHAASLVEATCAEIAVRVLDLGIRRFVIAGGETSGAVARALGARVLSIGPTIAPGVPWTRTMGHDGLALAFKSGNFGDANFFSTALEMCP
jgi:3-dehydrotetronate 4-kinase